MGEANAATIDLVAKDKRFRAVMGRTFAIMKKVQSRMEGVSRAAKRTLVVAGAALTTFLKLAADQEAAEKALDAALKQTGNSTVLWSQKLRDAASEIQKLTVHGDEANLMLMSQLLNLGIMPDRLDMATRATIGLSVALKQDLSSSMRNVALALNGQFTMLQRYIPALREAKSDTEKLDIVMKIAAGGFKQAEAQTDTLTGAFKQMLAAAGDLGEVIGDTWLPTVMRLTQNIRDAIPPMQEWVKSHREAIKTISLLVVGTAGASLVIGKFLSITAAATVTVFGLIKSLKASLPLMIRLSTAFFAFAATNPFALALIAAAAAAGGLVLWLRSITKEVEANQAALDGLNKTSAQARRDFENAQKDLSGATGLEEQATALKRIAIAGDLAAKSLESEIALLEKMGEDSVDLWIPMLNFRDAAEAAKKELVKVDEALKKQIATAERIEAWKVAWKEIKQSAFSTLDGILGKIKAVQEQGVQQIKSLTREIAVLQGTDPLDFQVEDLRALGVAEGFIKKIVSLTKQRRALEKGNEKSKELSDEAKALQDTLKTNQQLLAEELKRIDVLRQKKLLTEAEAKQLKANAAQARTEQRQASLLSSQALFARIQTAAASRRVATKPGATTVQLPPSVTKATQETATKTKESADSLAAIRDLAQQVIELIPNLGVFAR